MMGQPTREISEKSINLPTTLYIWLAIGAAIGWLYARLGKPAAASAGIESMAVGAFGAVLGGEFLADLIRGGVRGEGGFSVTSLGLAVGGCLVMLLLLRIMRNAVGPMKQGKAKRQR